VACCIECAKGFAAASECPIVAEQSFEAQHEGDLAAVKRAANHVNNQITLAV
jgi:hypothetical protein